MERESGYNPYQEQVRQARQTNLAEYLLRQGEPLVRVGQRYRHREHDSLVFTDNAYYWNSRGETGNAVDYLVRHKGMDFKTALYELTLTEIETTSATEPPRAKENFDFNGIVIEPDMRQTVAYLNKSRGISYELIKHLITDKLLFQEVQDLTDDKTTKPYQLHNIVFPMYDETGGIVGAETCGTLTQKRFKGIKPNSEYGYGYSIQGKAEIKYALFFESAVDLLSFIDIERLKNKPIDNTLLVSMAGLKDNVITHTLNRRNEPLQPVLCVDNDNAGQDFIERVKAQIKGIRAFLPYAQYKDWNEQLKATNENML